MTYPGIQSIGAMPGGNYGVNLGSPIPNGNIGNMSAEMPNLFTPQQDKVSFSANKNSDIEEPEKEEKSGKSKWLVLAGAALAVGAAVLFGKNIGKGIKSIGEFGKTAWEKTATTLKSVKNKITGHAAEAAPKEPPVNFEI